MSDDLHHPGNIFWSQLMVHLVLNEQKETNKKWTISSFFEQAVGLTEFQASILALFCLWHAYPSFNKNPAK